MYSKKPPSTATTALILALNQLQALVRMARSRWVTTSLMATTRGLLVVVGPGICSPFHLAWTK